MKVALDGSDHVDLSEPIDWDVASSTSGTQQSPNWSPLSAVSLSLIPTQAKSRIRCYPLPGLLQSKVRADETCRLCPLQIRCSSRLLILESFWKNILSAQIGLRWSRHGHWFYCGVISPKPATSKALLVDDLSLVDVPWLYQEFKYFYVIKL